MSQIVAEQLAPTQFLYTLALPQNARPDLAFQQTVVVAGTAGHPLLIESVPDLYYTIALSVGFHLDTTTGGPRVVVLKDDSQDLNMSINLATSPYAQPDNSSAQYSFAANLSTGFYAVDGGPTAFVAAGMPYYLLYPGDTLTLTVNAPFIPPARWTWSAITYTRIRIPTGPYLTTPPPAPIAPVVLT